MGIITLFIVLVCLILIGVPIAFAIGGSVIAYVMIVGFPPVSIMLQQSVLGIDSFVLMALPLFILAGFLMERGGSIDGLMELIITVFGRVPGGTAIANVVASAVFGTISGSGVATTLAIGQVMEPRLVKQGYPAGFAAGIDCASGLLGAVIPPSIALVIYGSLAEVSIRKIFAGAVIPGFMASGFLIATVLIIGKIRGYRFVKDENEKITLRNYWNAFLKAVPALMLPFIMLGGIFSGIFTPTEAAAVSVVYAYAIGKYYYKKLTMRTLWELLKESTKSTAAIMFIMSMAYAFSWIMSAEKIPEQVLNLFLGISQNKIVIIILINLLMLFLGCFMETISIIIMLTPILVPTITQLGIDPIQFGVIIALNLSIGAITPPLGIGLFASCRILHIDIDETMPDLFYFIGALVAALFVISLFPQTVSLLANL